MVTIVSHRSLCDHPSRISYFCIVTHISLELRGLAHRYGIEMAGDVSQWQEELLSRVCAKLYPLCDTLEQAYNAFDTSGDGNIDFKELVNGTPCHVTHLRAIYIVSWLSLFGLLFPLRRLPVAQSTSLVVHCCDGYLTLHGRMQCMHLCLCVQALKRWMWASRRRSCTS